MYTQSLRTFDNQSIRIGCVGKLGHLFGFLRHYLLIICRGMVQIFTNIFLESLW